MLHVIVRVRAGARKETVKKISETRFEFDVKEKPEGNRANKRVVELAAMHFGATTKSVRIVKGHHSPSKIVSIATRV